MSVGRRWFLKMGIACAAAFGMKTAGALAKGSAKRAVGDSTNGRKTFALGMDGKLVTVNGEGDAVPSIPSTDPAVRWGVPGRKWVMVFDLAACDGCAHCTKACQKMHFIPRNREWIRVYQMQDNPKTSPYWFPKPCFHCDNPPCTKVCPVGATFKREDGVVLIDNERCVGCRFCIAACPYSSRFFNWARPEPPANVAEQPYSPEHGYPRRIGTVEKCDFCPDMARIGNLPACAGTCPMGAIYYGDANEDAVTNSRKETLQFSKLLRDRAAYRYMEEFGTEPRVYYLPPANRTYAAPGEANKAKG